MWRCAERLTRGGIPAEAVLLEERSTSTRTNALGSLAMMQQRRCAAAAPLEGLGLGPEQLLHMLPRLLMPYSIRVPLSACNSWARYNWQCMIDEGGW